MTKLGCKRSEVKSYSMKRTRIKPLSKKQAKENAELKKLVDKLKTLTVVEIASTFTFFRSELSGDLVNYGVEPHHLVGRGKNLCNPFTIIMITREEHMVEQKHMGYEHKQELIAKIKPIRLAQGFKEEDYK